jgi:hypothetical protein
MPSGERPLDPARLGTRERALVVMALVHHGADAPAVLARLGPPVGERCGAAAGALLAVAGPERAAQLAREAARLFAPLPAGLAEVHPSWVAEALAEAPPAVRAALVAVLPPPLRRALANPASPAAARSAPAVLGWLTRRLLGGFVAMPAGPPLAAVPDALEELPRCAPEALEAWLRDRGRPRAAAALRAAPRSALAALCTRLPAPEAAALVAAVTAAPADATAARGATRELAELAAASPADAGRLLAALGARALGREVAGRGDLPRQIAQRLPVSLGREVLAGAYLGDRSPV